MVVIVDAIFVSFCRTTVPRTMAAATYEDVTSISTAGKRWNTMIPLGWSNKNRNKNKNKNNINYSGGNVTASVPADSYACAAAPAVSA
jgi:hypothetical protein